MAKAGVLYRSTLRCSPRTSLTFYISRTGRPPRDRRVSTDSRTLPKIAQTSVWQSLVPRGLRNRSEKAVEGNQKKPTNPASYFIWLYILIGSQAIRIMQVQTEFNTFMRRAELKIGKLREVVEALQRGEDIDVEKALGTGDEIQEREWEQALKEIENEDRIWQTNKQKKREAKAKAAEEAARGAREDHASPVNNAMAEHHQMEKGPHQQYDRPAAPGFY